nr:hypothetical protein CTI12_AA187700 [Tanacetum cinerariifolium]
MAIETEKNLASGSTVIDENRGRDDLRQNPKKRALNTLSGDLKREIHGLRDSFMDEITKIREEFGEEVSTLHQVIEALQADMALYRRSLATGGGNTNHGPKIDMEQYLEGVNVVDGASKIKMVTRYLKDNAVLWWRRRYGDIKRGTTTIDTWAKFVADFKKQFYPKNAKNEAKSRLRVQDLSTAIAHAEALIDFSTRRESSKPKDQKANQEKGGVENNAQPKVDLACKPPTEKDKNLKTSYKSGGCFICDGPHRAHDCPKKASLNGMSAHEEEDASDSGIMGSVRILNAIKAKTKGTNDLSVVPMDDFEVVFELEFLDKVRAFPMPFANFLCILDGEKTFMVSTEWDAKSGANTLSAMQFKKEFNKSEPCYLAVTRLETDEGSSKVEVPKVIERVLDEFKDVMSNELPKKLPPRREVDHTIELETGSKPPAKAPYRMPPSELEEKKDGSLRMCIDYWALNKAIYFTKLDLRSGYYQVWIVKGNEAKTPCVTRYGSYEFLVMPFGLTNAPVTFCTLMNKLFHMFLNKFVVVYLDDIVVYSHNLEEHVLHLKQVFQVLRDNELYVKLEKFSFAQDEVEFLGHKIKDGGLMMDGAKIKAIQDWEPPTKVTELRSFLGLVNYYRRFIMGYSAIASPLTDLLKKNKAWIWDEECQSAFESLKKAVMEEPVLRLSDVTMPFELHTDTSDITIGGVLMKDGHPIAFESRKLNETKRKYMVQEQETTTVAHYLRIWRHYLLGSRFVIKTDNIATSYFQTQKKLSPKQARWQDFLAEFDYQLEYKPGKANVVADRLSHKAEFATITQAHSSSKTE